MEYGTGRGKGPGGTKRRVFKNDEERKKHQAEYKKAWRGRGHIARTYVREGGGKKKDEEPTLKKNKGKFLITFD
tara:strand:- start:490 stop:711 length:222 start_codon:yes stop_codon:yes gene_type:complete